MNRNDLTALLTNTLIRDKLSNQQYYAREVTLDYGTNHPKRVDIMQFSPKGVVHLSDIEKGIFTCYEIKSCIDDVYSGHGLNFYGEKNYIVTTMETYKKLIEDMHSGKFDKFLLEKHSDSLKNFGIMVLVPQSVDLMSTDSKYAEFENPTPIDENTSSWKFYTIMPCRECSRKRSTTELLFCMLRSKHNTSNYIE